ncbi:hypothetical protein EST38_g13970 [Candolleomyces aberdarensis]|uniref:Uncharacterized protein n=1 Tax=Candolleomyces aberdarensis TaxID=2316362 RepID=A0A4Q2D190_9AGAR|nr:hypothetical protein EST38_g13970 [Candolleomyces aberdarensis]
MLVAASNGFVNSLRLHQPSPGGDELISEFKAENDAAVRVKGFITCLGMSPGGSMVAIGFDKSVQIASFPFIGLRDGSWPDGQLLPLEVGLGHHKEREFLTKYHPIPRKIHFLSDTLVCVTFLAGAQCFELGDGGWKHAWSMATPPGSFMGSTAVSPSKKVLVASNLTTGLDFYSFATQKFQMSTTANLGFPTKNYTLEAEFIDETTVVTGSNLGQIPVATNGAVDMVTTLGDEQRCPSQSVSAAKTDDNCLVVASACDNIVSIWYILPSVKSAVVATQEPTGEGGQELENEGASTSLRPNHVTSQSEKGDLKFFPSAERSRMLGDNSIIPKTKTGSSTRFRSIEFLYFLLGPFILVAYIVGMRRISSVPDWNTFPIDISKPLSEVNAPIISASDALPIGLSTETAPYELSTGVSSAANGRSTEANVLPLAEPQAFDVEADSPFGGSIDTVVDTDADDFITDSEVDMDREPIVITHTIIITRTVTRTVTHKPGRTVSK